MITKEEIKYLKSVQVTVPIRSQASAVSDAYRVEDHQFLRWVEAEMSGISLSNRLRYRLFVLKHLKILKTYKEENESTGI